MSRQMLLEVLCAGEAFAALVAGESVHALVRVDVIIIARPRAEAFPTLRADARLRPARWTELFIQC